MKTEIRNSISGLLLIPLLLACFALLPRVQAAPDPAPPPGNNTRDGAGAMANVTSGLGNSAFGTNALNKLTIGNNNAAQGNSALFSNISGSSNVAVGNAALRFNTDGFQNTAVGGNALNTNIGGDRNTALGYSALRSNTTNDNVAVGHQALFTNTAGSFNTAVGNDALASSTGSTNTALGAGAGALITTGVGNINIGEGVSSDTGASHEIRIGDTTAVTTTVIAGIRGTSVSGGQTVMIDANGKLGTVAPPSSVRFKDEIKPMDKSSEGILALKPVTFRYKKDVDPTGAPQFGLIAEEVEKVNSDLVLRNARGEIESVRYEAVNAMLLNEFLKEHRKVQELEKQVEKLTTGLQKVSDQLELNKPAPQVVNNP